MLVSRVGPGAVGPGTAAPGIGPVRAGRPPAAQGERSPAALALAMAELVDLDQMLQAARAEIRSDRRRLERAEYSVVGARLAAQAAAWIQPAGGRLRARVRSPLPRGALGAHLEGRASELSAADPADLVDRAAALLAAKADVRRADLRSLAGVAWAGAERRAAPPIGPGQAGWLADAVLAGTAPAVHALPPRAAGRLAAAAPESELFSEPEATDGGLGARLSSVWHGASRAATRGRLGPAAALLSGLVDVFWISGDGAEPPFVIGAIAALLNPATTLGLTVQTADSALARNRRRFHLRLAGLLLAPFPAG